MFPNCWRSDSAEAQLGVGDDAPPDHIVDQGRSKAKRGMGKREDMVEGLFDW